MEYRTLGGTGLEVSTHCLGTMMFGAWGNTDVDNCVATINAAIDGGINFVDTADVYSEGQSEEIVGRALIGRRDEVILATKVHGRMGPQPTDEGNSRVWIMREVESSLRCLGTDHIAYDLPVEAKVGSEDTFWLNPSAAEQTARQ